MQPPGENDGLAGNGRDIVGSDNLQN